MAKVIKYKFLSAKVKRDIEDNPDLEQILLDTTIECDNQDSYDNNYLIAKQEAIGEISVEGDFELEQPTQLDIIESQVSYTAMMTDTLSEV